MGDLLHSVGEETQERVRKAVRGVEGRRSRSRRVMSVGHTVAGWAVDITAARGFSFVVTSAAILVVTLVALTAVLVVTLVVLTAVVA